MILSYCIGIPTLFIIMFCLIKKEPEFWFIYWLLWVLIWVFLLCFSYAFGNAIPESEQNIVLDNTIHIKALRDNRDVTGVIYLGRGKIETEEYYYYVVNTNKGYETGKIRAENTYIKYSDDPRIETYTSKGFKNKTAWIYAVPNYEYKVIYIPEGSMITDYNIDLQ